jgi:hypothetical protein
MQELAYDVLEQSTICWIFCCLKVGTRKTLRRGVRLPCDFAVSSRTGAGWEGSLICQDRFSVRGR